MVKIAVVPNAAIGSNIIDEIEANIDKSQRTAMGEHEITPNNYWFRPHNQGWQKSVFFFTKKNVLNV